MTISADADALQARFVAQWAILRPTVPVAYENAPAIVPAPTGPWVRFAVRAGDLDRGYIGSGSGLYRGQGRVWVQVFVPRQSGTDTLNAIVDDVASIFRRWRSADGAIQTDNVEITAIPGDPAWHQVNVSIPYVSWRTL